MAAFGAVGTRGGSSGGGGVSACDIPATTVDNSAASAGVSANFSRCDHKHDVDVGTPVATAQTNAAGSATTLALSDHVHRTIVQVQDGAVLTGSRPTINFVSGATVVDNVGQDRIDVTVTASGGSILNHTIIVGNSLAGDTAPQVDYLDPGDGSGLEAALVAAAAYGGTGVDVLLRNGTYDFELGAVAGLLAIEEGVRLLGVNRDSVIIKTRTTLPGSETYAAFYCYSGSSIENLTVVVQPPTDAYLGSNTAFIGFVNTHAAPADNSLETLARRVNIVFSGSLSAAQSTNFGPIVRGFEFSNGAILAECQVKDAWSFLQNGGATPFVAFMADIDNGNTAPYHVSECSSVGTYLVADRGGDIGFGILNGPGTFTNCTVTEARLWGILISAEANSVQIIAPRVVWSTADLVGRVGIRVGLEPYFGNFETCVVTDILVMGGYFENGPTGAGSASGIGVQYYTSNGVTTTMVNRVRIMNNTIRFFVTGIYFREVIALTIPNGTHFAVLANNIFKEVTTNVTTSGNDVSTSNTNNVTDTTTNP